MSDVVIRFTAESLLLGVRAGVLYSEQRGLSVHDSYCLNMPTNVLRISSSVLLWLKLLVIYRVEKICVSLQNICAR